MSSARCARWCGAERFLDHVANHGLMPVPAQDMLASLTGNLALKFRLFQGLAYRIDETGALDRIIEAMLFVFERMIAFDRRRVDQGHGPDQQRLVMTVAIPAETLR